MFEVRDLTIAQGERPLWQGLSLVVKAGERLGVSAPSGHGKTTLGRVLAGWQPVRGSGEILLDRQPVPEQIKGYNPIQLVPQHPELTFNPYRTTGQALWDVWRPDDAMLARFMVKPAWLSRKPGQLQQPAVVTVGTDVGIAVFDDDQLAVAPQTTPGVNHRSN